MMRNHIILNDVVKEDTESFSSNRTGQHQNKDQKL